MTSLILHDLVRYFHEQEIIPESRQNVLLGAGWLVAFRFSVEDNVRGGRPVGGTDTVEYCRFACTLPTHN